MAALGCQLGFMGQHCRGRQWQRWVAAQLLELGGDPAWPYESPWCGAQCCMQSPLDCACFCLLWKTRL